MTRTRVIVTAPSRLHFGLLSFGQPEVRQYGGAGAMIDRPGVRVVLSTAERGSVSGPLADRVYQLLATGALAELAHHPTPVAIEVQAAPAEHVGLGTGTQLALALAAGLRALRCGPEARLDPRSLATLTGRGARSAIGTYGFCLGGMIVEAGKRAGEPLSPLVCRLALPDAWRFVLCRPVHDAGLYGVAEHAAFAALPPVRPEVTAALCRELLLGMVPAARNAALAEFSESLYRYGRQAGLCFAARHAGPYGSERLASLVATLRSLGAPGAGQSSWGPTLFALVADEAAARTLIADLTAREADVQCEIAAPYNRPAEVSVLPADD